MDEWLTIILSLSVSILPSPINSSLDLTPYSFFTGIGYLSPNETFIRANFHVSSLAHQSWYFLVSVISTKNGI